MKKRIFIIYLCISFATGLIYMAVRDFAINGVTIANLTILVLYSGMGMFAGWERLTFRFETKMHRFVRILYYIPKGYLSIYFGLLCFPFWFYHRFLQQDAP